MNSNRIYHQRLFLGCGTLALAVMFGVLAVWWFILDQDQQQARYPGAVYVSDHANYAGLPRQFRRDNTYRTTDSFPEVYNWYSTTFDLGAENRANGRCIILEGNAETFLARRTTTVSLCNTPEGQLIFVSRTTQLGK